MKEKEIEEILEGFVKEGLMTVKNEGEADGYAFSQEGKSLAEKLLRDDLEQQLFFISLSETKEDRLIALKAIVKLLEED